jgi:hypothetical protein
VGSSVKVRQTGKVPLVSSIEIRAARNEFESFQVVVTAKSPLSAVTVTAPTLVLDGSPTTTIPSSEIRLYREQNIYFTSPSNPEGERGWWSDALVPARDDGAAVFNNSGVWSEGLSSGEDEKRISGGRLRAEQSRRVRRRIASYRLKMIREGLEDYEYLTLCKAVNPGTAMNIARGMFPMSATGANGQPTGSMYAANNYPGSPPGTFADNLESARVQLAQCITGSAGP